MSDENTLECNQCGHKWKPRVDHLPVQCPRCKRYDWDEEPKKRATQ